MLYAVDKGGGMMTREEAIAYGNDYYRDLMSACCKIDEKHKEFVRMSLEALEQEPCEDATLKDIFCMGCEYKEQEPILDKIRVEIEEKARPNEIGGRGNGKSIRYGLCMALQIIDKYKAESEGE